MHQAWERERPNLKPHIIQENDTVLWPIDGPKSEVPSSIQISRRAHTPSVYQDNVSRYVFPHQ